MCRTRQDEKKRRRERERRSGCELFFFLSSLPLSPSVLLLLTLFLRPARPPPLPLHHNSFQEETHDEQIVAPYRLAAAEMLEQEHTTLYVDFQHVEAFSEELARTCQQEFFRCVDSSGAAAAAALTLAGPARPVPCLAR